MTGRERLQQTFAGLQAQGKKALITYITAGDPDLDTTVEVAAALAGAGADIIELGLPFSDPMADGPVIQAASQRSLAGGTTVAGVLDTVARIRRQVKIPLAVMSYYNPIFRYGIEDFVHRGAAAGLDALIVPDLPMEEGGALQEAATKAGLEIIYFLAPTSTLERIKATAHAARGFIYCLAVKGITGERNQVAGDLTDFLARVRPHTDTPLAVGFGISQPDQAREVARHADGVIVGSALVRLLQSLGQDRKGLVAGISAFTASLREAVDSQ